MDTSALMNDAISGAVGATKDYSDKLDAFAKKGGGTNTGGMKKTLEEEKKVTSQLPTEFPKAPKLNTQLPQAPVAPEIEPMNVFKEFAPALAVFGSLKTRGSLTSAINSAASAMQSYHENRIEDFKLKREQWADETKRLTEQNQIELDAYKAAIEESKGDVGLLQAKLTALGTQFQDEHSLASIQSGNMDKALQMYEKKAEINTKLVDSLSKYRKLDAGSISPETADFVADQVLAGDKSGLTNFGRGSQGAQNLALIRDRVTEKARERGISGGDLAKIDAGFKSLQSAANAQGRMKQGVTAAANILESSIPSLITIAKKYDLSPSTDLNKAYNFINSHGSNEDKANFSTQLRAVTTDYALLIGRGKMTVHSDDEALKILNDSMGISSLEGFRKAAEAETKNIKEGLKNTEEELFGKGDKSEKIINWDDLK